MNALVTISRKLSAQVDTLRFPSVPFVYNPLDYARAPHEAYLERWGAMSPRELLMVGMNPGPFGMAQTGVPFGDVAMVRDFLGIEGAVGRPAHEHPRRPIVGFDCHAIGGERHAPLGLGADRFGTAERFFERVFVANWCPLVFMEESGRNRPPDKLAAAERIELFRALQRRAREGRGDAATAARGRHRPVRRAASARGARLHLADRVDPASEPGEPGCEHQLGGPRRRAAPRPRLRPVLGGSRL